MTTLKKAIRVKRPAKAEWGIGGEPRASISAATDGPV